MNTVRKIKQVWPSRPTIEGAGVRLKRAFGFQEVPLLDPFLLLDDFHSKNPQDYLAGFPWHPHRGIETITYMLHGKVSHQDSLGNSGVIDAGDVQWMTAGSGIIHQEMPQRTNGLLAGFQLWANLPASHKMMPPRYRGITRDQIPTITLDESVEVKIISGEVAGKRGPVQDIITNPEYLDLSIAPHSAFQHDILVGYTAFAYVIEGRGRFHPEHPQLIDSEHLVLFDDGTTIKISTEQHPLRCLLISGKSIQEPIAWRGPIVMNTNDELAQAFREYQLGTFIKHERSVPSPTRQT